MQVAEGGTGVTSAVQSSKVQGSLVQAGPFGALQCSVCSLVQSVQCSLVNVKCNTF